MSESKFSTWTFVILLLLSLALVVHLLFGFFTPAVMAMVIVSIFNPMHKKIDAWLGRGNYYATCVSTFVIFLCVLAPLSLFIVTLTREVLSLYQSTQTYKGNANLASWVYELKRYLDMVTEYLSAYGLEFSPEPIIKMTTNFSQALAKLFYDSLGLIATNLVTLSFNIFLTVALVFVFFVSGKSAKNFVMDLIPIPDQEKERLINRFRELASAIFLGNGLVSIVEGALGGILLFIFGIPGALIWGIVMSVAAFLPLVGASVVVIPATLYLLLAGDIWPAILYAALNTVQMITLETIVKPRLIGNKSQMHAILVFLSIISGVQVYGVLGLFYGPLLVTMFLSLAQIYKEHYRDRLLKT